MPSWFWHLGLQLTPQYVQGFHRQFSQLQLSGSQCFCFSASGTPSRSVMAPITGLLQEWTTKRCKTLEQTWEETGCSFSSVWEWGHFQGAGPNHQITPWHSVESHRRVRIDEDIQEMMIFERAFAGAYIRDHATQRLAWDYYSKIDLKSKKLDLMLQDALSNPLFLWLAVHRAGDCAVLLVDIRGGFTSCLFFVKWSWPSLKCALWVRNEKHNVKNRHY